MKFSFRHTKAACYIGYVTQAIVCNLPPLLFVTFEKQFGLSLDRITAMIAFIFIFQLFIDAVSVKMSDRLGYRLGTLLAAGCSAVGLILMSVLPFVLPPLVGLYLSLIFTSIGGGLVEVLITPVVEAIPGDSKGGDVLLLHSFYSWGQAAVVLFSTVYFLVFGLENWRFLPLIWAIVPAADFVLFLRVPLASLPAEPTKGGVRRLMVSPLFILLFLMMVAAGSSEIAISQWASLFAEEGLKVSKYAGDLLGPFLFAVLMGLARVFFGKCANRIHLEKAVTVSSVMCVISYAIIVFSPNPFLSLVGCGLTGLSVGILWPAILHLGARAFPTGGNPMFALMALGGDVGCILGPFLIGKCSSALQKSGSFLTHLFAGDATETGLKGGILVSILFPLLLLISVILFRALRHKRNRSE